MLLDIASFIFAMAVLLGALFLLIVMIILVLTGAAIFWENVKKKDKDDGSESNSKPR